MEKSIFGNLNDWGIVLEKLELLSESKEIGNHQDDLIRLLRFNQNWRLREAAIESLPAVDNPDFDLAREVTALMKRKDLYYDVRILATDGVEKLAASIAASPTSDKEMLREFVNEVISDMDALLDSPEPPKFHNALQNSMEGIKKIQGSI